MRPKVDVLNSVPLKLMLLLTVKVLPQILKVEPGDTTDVLAGKVTTTSAFVPFVTIMSPASNCSPHWKQSEIGTGGPFGSLGSVAVVGVLYGSVVIVIMLLYVC